MTQTGLVRAERALTSMRISAIVASEATVTATTTTIGQIEQTAPQEIGAATSVKVLAPKGRPYQLKIVSPEAVGDGFDTLSGIGLGQRPLEYFLYHKDISPPAGDRLHVQLNF